MNEKRFVAVIMVLLMIVCMSGCGNTGNSGNTSADTGNVTKIPETAEEIMYALKNVNPNVGEIVVYDESTDPNGNLGRPGQYTGKADFEDITVEQDSESEFVNGGTVEVFASKADCDSRYSYLKGFMGADMGILGLNQYMYKYDKVIFRVSFDVLPSAAEEYKSQMDELLHEEGEIGEAE
jgi:hypothetical protein